MASQKLARMNPRVQKTKVEKRKMKRKKLGGKGKWRMKQWKMILDLALRRDKRLQWTQACKQNLTLRLKVRRGVDLAGLLRMVSCPSESSSWLKRRR
jgi:hypothetical protein